MHTSTANADSGLTFATHDNLPAICLNVQQFRLRQLGGAPQKSGGPQLLLQFLVQLQGPLAPHDAWIKTVEVSPGTKQSCASFAEPITEVVLRAYYSHAV